MLTECIASVSSEHRRVITRRVEEKVLHCTQHELQTRSALNPTCNYPRMAGQNESNISSKHCFRSLCIKQSLLQLKRQTFICSI